MKPFLLLASRAEDAPAAAEYEAFLRFGKLTHATLVRHRMEATPIGRIDLDHWSGIILGGSPYTVSEEEAAKSSTQRRVEADLSILVDEIIERDFPFLGACYGIGILGRHLGAVVDGTYNEAVGPATLQLTAAGRHDPLLGVLPPTFEAFVGHKEAITALPDGIESLAVSEACPVQAFRVGANVYATQFHPELDIGGIITRIDAYAHYGYFQPEEAESLKDAARRSNVCHPAAIVRRFVERYARS